MKDAVKLIAAYKAGYLGNNILDTYFSFVANMLLEGGTRIVEDATVAAMVEERYGKDMKLPLPLIRQILGVGVQNGCFVEDHGQYSVAQDVLSGYKLDSADFDSLWERLKTSFLGYCQQNDVDITDDEADAFILNILDDSDEMILSHTAPLSDVGLDALEYTWYSFVRSEAENETELYSFIAALSASNITKQSLFYNGEGNVDYSGLQIYLDSPIIFALLGMDSVARKESYEKLLQDMKKAGCEIHVFDHNFQEVDGIIARAAGWATSTQYDIGKANNATRFFHDSQMSESDISEYCDNLEGKLNSVGITVVSTAYDIHESAFQESETKLFDMITQKYSCQGSSLTDEREKSVRVDIRSIIMVYRKRQGQQATRIQNAKHLLITSNNAIANVSKSYESNQSIDAGHIPACVSADLFGAILWLNTPTDMIEYQKEKLLADCYAFLRPSKELLNKYIQSLDEARNADQIDEERFLFLRTHKVVLDSLMNVTKGDYARFNSNTYLEVYEDIQAKSRKMYEDEASSHDRTRKELQNLKEQSAIDQEHSAEAIEMLSKRVSEMEEIEQRRVEQERERKIQKYGWVFTSLFIGIPYVLALTVIEVVKAQYSSLSWETLLNVGALVLVSVIILPLGFTKGKLWCFKIAKRVVEKKEQKR